jgi:hypothetical protein
MQWAISNYFTALISIADGFPRKKKKSTISQLDKKFPGDKETEISSQYLKNSVITRHQEHVSLYVTFI